MNYLTRKKEEAMSELNLKKDQVAPDFLLFDHNQQPITLQNYSGKWLVIFIYPRDLTPGCTAEAKDFTKWKEAFASLNACIIGVNKDTAESHKDFSQKESLQLDLLTDPTGDMVQAYGAWRVKKLYGREFAGILRSTFLISPDGKVCKVWYNVKVDGHAEQVLDTLKEQIIKD